MVVRLPIAKLPTFASVLAPVLYAFFAASAFATPTRLDCTLKSSTAEGKIADRAITIIFDTEANTLALSQGAQPQKFANVTMSNVSINGNTDDMSIGIDRSSWSVVLQTYSQDHVSNEFGTCRPPAAPTP